MPDRIPLAKNKEFKSIKNAIIKEALKLNLTEDEVEKNENTDEESVLNPFEYEENTSAESVFDSDKGVLYPHYSIKTNRNSVAVSSLYLLRYLCNIIENRLRFEEKQKAQRTDKKLQQKINDKKQARGVEDVSLINWDLLCISYSNFIFSQSTSLSCFAPSNLGHASTQSLFFLGII